MRVVNVPYTFFDKCFNVGLVNNPLPLSPSGWKWSGCKQLTAPALLFAGLSFAACAAQVPHIAGGAAATGVDRDIDPEIAAAIAAISAIDNHAHPVLPPPNDRTDRNFDALPVDNMEPETEPIAGRPDNPQLKAAWKALWGFDGAVPLNTDAMKQLHEVRARAKARAGEHYADWVLDRAGIGIMLGNRVSMGPGLAKPRFEWVPYVDALLFPLDNSVLETTPDRKQFFPLEERLRAQYLKAVGLDAVPRTLTEYLTQVVTPTLERQKDEGAVAEKFEVAYLRSFDFADTPRVEAERIYSKWVGRGRPDPHRVQRTPGFPVSLHRIRVRPLGHACAFPHYVGWRRVLRHRARKSTAARICL